MLENVRQQPVGGRLGVTIGSLEEVKGVFGESDRFGLYDVIDKGLGSDDGNVMHWDRIDDMDGVVKSPQQSPEDDADQSPEPSTKPEQEPTKTDVLYRSREDEDFGEMDVKYMAVDETDEEYKKENGDADDDIDIGDKEEEKDELKMLTSDHKKSKPLSNIRKVRMFVASRTTAHVWRNFKHAGKTGSWRNGVELQFKARVGDAITIKTQGWKGHYGVIAMIHDGRKRWFMTGGRGRKAFKAISMSALKRIWKPDLRRPGRPMCYLRHPYIVQRQRGRGVRYAKNSEAKMLYRYGAKYVWARGASWRMEIGMRFVVGGVHCKKQTPAPSPKAVGGARCACRLVHTNMKGDCFEFRNKRFTELPNKVELCRRRVCGLKYECVQPGRSSSIVCVRRLAQYEVRSIGPVYNGKCRNVPLRPAQAYYAPYS